MAADENNFVSGNGVRIKVNGPFVKAFEVGHIPGVMERRAFRADSKKNLGFGIDEAELLNEFFNSHNSLLWRSSMSLSDRL
jgi:hypothetical protein